MRNSNQVMKNQQQNQENMVMVVQANINHLWNIKKKEGRYILHIALYKIE